jgi:putative tryptophan/tyrosine transport system substrate-binding protein
MRLITLVLMLCAYLPQAAMSQDQRRPPPLVGWLRVASPEQETGKPLRDALAKLGLMDGRDFRLDVRSADGDVARIPALARALVQEAPAIIVAFGPDAARASQGLTSTIPIIAAAAFLEERFATSLARPQGNLTGVSLLVPELDAKKLEVLHELMPHIRHVGVLNDLSTNIQDRPAALTTAAGQLGLKLTTVDVKHPDEFDAAFQAFRSAGAEAVTINASTLFATLRQRLGELSGKHRLPAICQWKTMAEAGCLASYGARFDEMIELIADQVARVLRGIRPEAIPIAQPRQFELVVNQRRARELGLMIPQRMLDRADEVID